MLNINFKLYELNKNFDLKSFIHTKFQKYNNLYMTIDYINLYSNKNSKNYLFLFEKNKKSWAHIFQKSEINDKFIKDKNIKYYDIESPYGFYGPISNSEDKNFINQANNFFDQWCCKNNIIAEFIRFNPLLSNHNLRTTCDISVERKNLFFNLNNLDNHKNFKIFNSKIMNQINNYKKYNLEIVESHKDSDYFDFIKIYLENMKNLKVHKFYEFNDKFYKELLKLIKKNGYLLICRSSSEVIGGTIILFDKINVYYFLSAINKDYKISGISNSLIYFAIQKTSDIKRKIFYLGGGNSSSSDDNLFKFKKKMSNEQCNFYIGKKIFIKSIYERVCRNWSFSNNSLYKRYNKYLLKYKFN